MTKQIEVITSVQRRRRWSRSEKERIVAAAIEPGAVGVGGGARGRHSYEPVVSMATGAVPFRAERSGERARVFRGDDCSRSG